MKYLLFILALFLTTTVDAQRAVLSGIITDASTGETLVGATVLIKGDVPTGTTTDENGFFSLPGVDASQFNIEVSFIGYQSQMIGNETKGANSSFIVISLHPSAVELDQITVVETAADRLGDRDVEISRHTLTSKVIKSIPTARNDVFKALRYLPGIESTEPLSPLVSVRGSDPGENLIMLDGVTIYNPYHFMSSSGIFNMLTVKQVDLMVGGFGAEYGGRNASVINIATKDGNNSKLHGEIKPSTAESKLFLEFPLGDKSTMMVAGRINYDIPGNFLLYSNNYFYDMNLSFTHRFSAKHRLTLKYFGSRDKTNLDFNNIYQYIGNSFGMEDIFNDISLQWINKWSNYIGTAIWKSVLTPRLFLRAQAYGSLHRANNYSQLKFEVEDEGYDTSTRFKSRVNDWSGKVTLSYRPFLWNELKVGAEYNAYLFTNGTELNHIDNGTATKTPQLLSWFVEDKIVWGALTIRPGLRLSQFENQKLNYDPRLNAVLKLNNDFQLKAAWGKYHQYIVSMNTQEFEFNQFLDYYYPLNGDKPSESTHYILGAEKKINRKNTLSADVYYKAIDRTYTFDLLQDQSEAFALSDRIIAGDGKAYGIELMWKGAIGPFSGWGSYTLSHAVRSFPNIMDGEEYDYDYDRRHSLKVVMNYKASERIDYSCSFVAQSGLPKSVENTLQFFYQYDPLTGSQIYSPQYTVNKKNATRLPWVFYLDFGLQKQVVSGFGKDLADFFGADESYFVLNVYNALFFRRNVLYYLAPEGDDRYIPFGDNYLPTVSAGYTIKF